MGTLPLPEELARGAPPEPSGGSRPAREPGSPVTAHSCTPQTRGAYATQPPSRESGTGASGSSAGGAQKDARHVRYDRMKREEDRDGSHCQSVEPIGIAVERSETLSEVVEPIGIEPTTSWLQSGPHPPADVSWRSLTPDSVTSAPEEARLRVLALGHCCDSFRVEGRSSLTI